MQRVRKSGNYAVIGSFREIRNAVNLVRNHNDFEFVIVPADVNGKKIYRVVYGPVLKGTEETVRNSFYSVGIESSWLIWLDSEMHLMSKFEHNIFFDSESNEFAYLTNEYDIQ